MGCPPNFLVAVSHNVFHALTNCYSYTRNIAASLPERLKSISDMVSNGGDLASCVFCDFCVSDANYQEHLQVRAVPVSKSDLRHISLVLLKLCSAPRFGTMYLWVWRKMH